MVWIRLSTLTLPQIHLVGSGLLAVGDAAPYFRIFNPTSQQQKFDPEEKYIDRWVVRDDTYPEPIVDHAEARKQALSALKQVTGK